MSSFKDLGESLVDLAQRAAQRQNVCRLPNHKTLQLCTRYWVIQSRLLLFVYNTVDKAQDINYMYLWFATCTQIKIKDIRMKKCCTVVENAQVLFQQQCIKCSETLTKNFSQGKTQEYLAIRANKSCLHFIAERNVVLYNIN